MNPAHFDLDGPHRRRLCATWLPRAATALALVLVTTVSPLSGCGGGVGEGGTGYASGPITGFGSVIVNDIVFDDSAATVEDGEGTVRARAELRLGMTVEIDSDAIRGNGARAARVRFDSAVRGPVESVESDGFVVLGQRVAVDDTTVYDSALAAGLDALAPGQIVEVYGLFDAGTSRFRATRVELRTFVLVYQVRGVVSEIAPGSGTLRIGNALFDYRSAGSTPSDLGVGSFVRLLVSKTPGVLRWQVLRFGEAQRVLPDTEGVSIKGLVTGIATSTSFRVDGRPVDARAATVTDGPLALGLRVEVSGSLRAGVLVANSVTVRSDQFERERGFELRGDIESVAGSPPTSLVLRGITVGLTRPPQLIDGSPSDLVVGRAVEVRGVVSVGNGARLDAVTVKFR